MKCERAPRRTVVVPIALLVLALIPSPAPASTPPEPNEAEDLFYLAPDRLIVLRLRVRIDGEAVRHTASAPHGLITFDLPEGTHLVELKLEDTATRRLANSISLASWGALLLAVPIALLTPSFVAWRRRSGPRRPGD